MSEPPETGALAAIRQRLASQAKMLAIKLYRDATGAAPAQAKEAVDRIGAGKAPKKPAAAPPVSPEARAVGEALRAGDRLEAIRLYRAATGTGLEEATAAIDAIMAEKRAGPRPMGSPVIGRRRINPVLALLALGTLFGTVFGLVMLLLGG